MILLALALFAQTAPTAEAETLGRRLAETGTLATLLPMMIAKDTEELVGEHPDWNDADKVALRATAGEVAKGHIDRLMATMGHAYAERLSLEDLRALVAFGESDAAKHQRAAMPAVIAEAMGAVGQVDFKADTRKAFCEKTGKGCPAK